MVCNTQFLHQFSYLLLDVQSLNMIFFPIQSIKNAFSFNIKVLFFFVGQSKNQIDDNFGPCLQIKQMIPFHA